MAQALTFGTERMAPWGPQGRLGPCWTERRLEGWTSEARGWVCGTQATQGHPGSPGKVPALKCLETCGLGGQGCEENDP